MSPQCRALELSDPTAKTPCDKPATSTDGRLCSFHARQCHALYKGYKRRNAQLDSLTNLMPSYLASTKTALVNQNFEDVSEEKTLRELHAYLFKRQNILSSVIRGRKLHHSHFFAVDMDYGHEKYLAQLQKEKHTIARALERLGRRTADILYAQRSWFPWVRQCQDDDEAQRENESKKVKLEAQLFRRHQKEVLRHQKEVMAKENQKRAEAFLNEVYTQRLSEMTEAEQEEWDPVQDVAEDERDSYIDLIKYFLMLKDSDSETSDATKFERAGNGNGAGSAPPDTDIPKTTNGAKKKGKKSKADPSKTDPVKTNPAMAEPGNGKTNGTSPEKGSASNIEMETQAQIRSRLKEGVNFIRGGGMHIAGTVEAPLKLMRKSAPMPDNEIDDLLQDIAQIKTLLFCRLLLSHAKLLPVALRVESIEEFLNDAEVTLEDLRDLCLKVEQPGLQEVRDACADFARGDEEEEDQLDDSGAEEEGDETATNHGYRPRKMSRINGLDVGHVYQTKREKAMIKKRQEAQEILEMDDPATSIDFGVITDEGQFSKKKMRIRICGHYIHNYPSEKAMNRGGWFHFCVIAKDSNLFDAITLCRHWDEFFELNVLATYHYFPGTHWMTWVGDRLRNQLMSLGFIPYVQNDVADEFTGYYQSPRRQGRRSHHITEMRNFICGHVKRNDAASRRLIQYLSMETSKVIVLVRDAKTGQVLVTPPDDQLWLVRQKTGLGRAAKNDYDVLKSVGTEFFEAMDSCRRWHFGFTDYYDIYLWDATAGETFPRLYNKLRQMLLKAQRCVQPLDYFNLAGPVIKTLTRDRDTMRARTIKPGEVVESIWDEIHHPETRMRALDINNQEVKIEDSLMSYLYNEADVLEDQILFPEEVLQNRKNELFKDNPNEIQKFERGPPGDLRRFVNDMDTDEELSDDEDHLKITEGEPVLHASQGGEPINDDDAWTDTSDESSMGEEEEKALIAFEFQFKESLANKESLAKDEKEDRVRNLAKPLLDATIRWPSSDTSMIDADMMAIMRLSLTKTDRDYADTSDESMRKEYLRFIDRTKSKIFKDCWHKADLSPGAAETYAELLKVVRKADDYIMSKINMGPYEMLAFMGMASKITQHRRIVPDAFLAYAAIHMFFETTGFLSFALKDSQLDLSESLLLNQAERAKHPPSRRTYKSNKTIDKGFFKVWDDLLRANRRKPGQDVDDIYPLEWDIAVRPIVAHLYKAGVIGNSYAEFVYGKAVPIAEPSRPMDLYIDWRLEIDSSRPIIPSHIEDPTKLTADTLLDSARKFATSNPGARFSILRLWSAPHFYPLMVGPERRASTSFLDSVGRAWEWKFVPKDMPCSEWSIQYAARMRIDPYKRQLGDQVVLKRDLYLVMGKDADDCKLRSAGVTWAVQTEPWRLEVDFWRSFVGVDLEFLEGLDKEWLD